MKCVISGSFRKHYDDIAKLAQTFGEQEIEVLSPKISRVINVAAGFAFLESDASDNPKTVERGHLDAIRRADFLYIYNPGGAIGPSVTLEVGYAIALNKPIFAAVAQ